MSNEGVVIIYVEGVGKYVGKNKPPPPNPP